MEKVRESKGAVTTKIYYAHLFNDALVYSARNMVGTFKLHKAIELTGAKITTAALAFGTITNTFTVTAKGKTTDNAAAATIDDGSGEKVDVFRCAVATDAAEWFSAIQTAISSNKTRKVTRRASALQTKLPGVDLSKLSPRAGLIHTFLERELQFIDAMQIMNMIIIQPLIDASKGAALSVASISSVVVSGANDSAFNVTDVTAASSSALFSDQKSASRSKALAVTQALQASDIQIFLRATEALVVGLRDFVTSFENACKAGLWGDHLQIGGMFAAVSVRGIYNQFKSYASSQLPTLRILKTEQFSQFYRDAELSLNAFPGNFEEKLEIPRNHPNLYFTFLEALLRLTPQNHPDHAAVTTSLELLRDVSREVEDVVRARKNFEKLLDIQSSLVSASMFGNEPIIESLASTSRTYIKEGDLKKVCRKANKTFRFWLFNDYIIYGSSMGGATFTFHRAIELRKCSVGIHNSATLKHAFEIFGSEKSFIVIAATAAQQADWLSKIQEAKASLGVPNDTSTVAPLWVPDHGVGGDKCVVCSQVRLAVVIYRE